MNSTFDCYLINIIEFYQKRISPIKGFQCAYRSLYGGASCSEHIKYLIKTFGFRISLRKVYNRLIDCRGAYYIVKDKKRIECRNKNRKTNFWADMSGNEQCCFLLQVTESSCVALSCLFF